MRQGQTIFLTGASGFIGGSLAIQLMANGHRVRGLVRSADKAAQLSALGIEAVMGDLDDLALLSTEVKNADAVINTASADHAASVGAMLQALEGSHKVFIHTSGSSIVGDDVRGSSKSEVIFDESTPLQVHALKQSRRNIDLSVLNAASRGVQSVVICPSLIYGVGKGLHTTSVQIPFLVSNAIKHGVVQIVGQGKNTWSNVHIDDVVDLYVLALDKAPAGAFYFAANGEASFLDLGQALTHRLQFSKVEHLTPELAAAQWGVGMAYFSLGSNSRVRSVRARTELNWMPRHASVLEWISAEMPIPEH
jgi:nucleoside-diphosphate-sugar epimerase